MGRSSHKYDRILRVPMIEYLRRRSRVVYVRIIEMSFSSDKVSEIVTERIPNNDLIKNVVSNLRDCIMSMDTEVALSGNYRFKLKKHGL